MATKATGLSLDLIIHPGETIADILKERGISQAELASRTGVTPAYISSVIAGKKNISASFSMKLEYALNVPKSFWLNLQAKYDAELLEFNEEASITEEEKTVRKRLSEMIKHLRDSNIIPPKESISQNIITLRKFFQVSNLCNLNDLIPNGAFRISSKANIDPYILGAWLRLCQISAVSTMDTIFNPTLISSLISKLKDTMLSSDNTLQESLVSLMREYGIDFSVMPNFRGAPVNGYICQSSENRYQMVLTIRGAFADIFWFSLFHELGHIVNGDVSASSKFIDICSDNTNRELAADEFAKNALIAPDAYKQFLETGDYSISSIMKFAETQRIMPYIVIGRLQKEEHIPYSWYNEYKDKYVWRKH